jgi:hypothetical protein
VGWCEPLCGFDGGVEPGLTGEIKLTLYLGSSLFVLLQASELSLEPTGIQPK